tara:strand:- start:359 stop:859 length:501 start_codon:yes stop_codon:yes gene_type:complete
MNTTKKIGYLLIVISAILIVLLGFVKADIDNRDAFLCEAVHTNPDLNMTQCPAHTSNTSWFVIIAFGLSFIILAAGITLVMIPAKVSSPQKSSEHKRKPVDKEKLDNDEKKIHSILEQNDGSYYQSDLIKETGLSKVKITRILDKMEGKNIIDRKRRGMTNIIILK